MKLRRPSAEEHVHAWSTDPGPADAWPHYRRSDPSDDQSCPSAPPAPWSEPLLQSLMPLPQPHYHSPCLVSGEAYHPLQRITPPRQGRRLDSAESSRKRTTACVRHGRHQKRTNLSPSGLMEHPNEKVSSGVETLPCELNRSG